MQQVIRSSQRPILAIVSGCAGSGKTTLARALAQAVSCPLISRDEINEGIFQTFNHDMMIASKDTVAKIAFDTFFQTIELLVSARVTLVAEAAFQDYRWRIGLEPILGMADVRLVHCTVAPDLACQRIARRKAEQQATPRGKRNASQVGVADKRATVDESFVPPFAASARPDRRHDPRLRSRRA